VGRESRRFSKFPMSFLSRAVFVSLVAFVAGCVGPNGTFGPATVAIVAARDTGDGRVMVKVHYSNVVPGKFELNVGLGYYPPDDTPGQLPARASDFYSILHWEVLKSAAGDVTVSMRKSRLTETFDGTAHANISAYPHGGTWSPVSDDEMKVSPP
jgi:hypothetical protein